MVAYLRRNKPARRQFRTGRRSPGIKPVIMKHTAESVMDTTGPDTGAENVAAFIQRRADPGSYHDLVDSDSIIKLVEYTDEAFHCGVHNFNRWSTGVSYACRTSDWRRMSAARRKAFLRNGAVAAAWQARWIEAETGVLVPARRLTLAQALRYEPGFIAHGDADPGRRSDPGVVAPNLFPWDEFFQEYEIAISRVKPADPTERQAKMHFFAVMNGQTWYGDTHFRRPLSDINVIRTIMERLNAAGTKWTNVGTVTNVEWMGLDLSGEMAADDRADAARDAALAKQLAGVAKETGGITQDEMRELMAEALREVGGSVDAGELAQALIDRGDVIVRPRA